MIWIADNDRGASTLEFSCAGPVVLFLLLITADLGRAAYSFVGAQYALCSTARWFSLGESLPELSREESAVAFFRETLETFGIERSAHRLHICPVKLAPCAVDTAGIGEEVMLLRAELSVRSLLLGYRMPLSLEAIVINEPF